MKPYYPLLDAARFFAAFWVMNFHYLLVAGLSNDLNWYRYGNLGVQIFFIISGFVIVESLKDKTIGEFLTGRLIRLYPLFWIMCTVTYLLSHIVPEAKSVNISEYLLSMTMLSDPLNEMVHGTMRLVDPSYWTLTVELIFYVAIGSFVALFRHRNIRFFFMLWLMLSMVAFAFHLDQNFYMKLALVRHASYFIFGGALALIVSRHATNAYEVSIDRTLLVVSAVYSLYIQSRAIPLYMLPNPKDWAIVASLLIATFISIIVLVYASRFIQNDFAKQVLLILGGLTYPLYLLHQEIGNMLMNLIINSFNISWTHVAVGFQVFITAVAYIVYVQEKKMRLWLWSVVRPAPAAHREYRAK